MTTAKAIVSLLTEYQGGASYEALVDVMRDLATGLSEAYMFEDGSSIIIEQDDRDESGMFRKIRVLTDEVELGNVPDDKPKRKKKKEGKGE